MKIVDMFEESDDELFEMSNFKSRTTGLPPNIEVWVRTDPLDHGHDKYRLKILKDKQWSAIFSVGSVPVIRKNINSSLSTNEITQITNWIKEFYPLLISHIDGKLDSGEVAIELQKLSS